MITAREEVRHDFSDHERGELGKQLAKQYGERNQMDAELESIKRRYKAREAAIEEETIRLTGAIQQGWEMRPVDLLYLKFRPNAQDRTVIRLDTCAVLRTDTLRSEDRQVSLTETPDRYAFDVELVDSDGVPVTLPLFADESKLLEEAYKASRNPSHFVLRPRLKQIEAAPEEPAAGPVEAPPAGAEPFELNNKHAKAKIICWPSGDGTFGGMIAAEVGGHKLQLNPTVAQPDRATFIAVAFAEIEKWAKTLQDLNGATQAVKTGCAAVLTWVQNTRTGLAPEE